MNRRTSGIIIALLIAVIVVSSGYIIKTLFFDKPINVSNEKTEVTQTAQPSPAATAETQQNTSGGSAAASQGAQFDPAQPKTAERTPSSSSSGAAQQVSSSGKIIVLDPGHGKSSSLMSAEEKTAEGYVQNNGSWGEWRHWKSGSSSVECHGTGCTGRAPSGSSCWYRMGNGDRDKEPEINLRNASAAKNYLEQMGYTVRMTRTSNDQNPSFSKRVSYCYPNNDNSSAADAEIYVCIHSNAGGGSGSAYITAGGAYDQIMKNGANSTYAENSNALGKMINDRIVAETSLSKCGGGTIGGEEALIAFCKSPVPVGYVEIGFYDNSSDLSIINSEYDAIGKAIAEGVNDYLTIY